MVQSLYKTDSWFHKSHEELGQLQTTSGNPKKLKFGGLLLSKKYICPKSTFLQLKHYIRSIYLTIALIPCGKTYQTTYVIFETAFIFRHLSMPSTERNDVFRHFWNHRSFFMTQVLCIFLAQTLHTFYKSIPSKCKFPDFWLLAWKLSKFLKSFFKPQVSFHLNFASPFSVMTHNSSAIF